MVINTILTQKLKNLHVPIPSDNFRARSIPNLSKTNPTDNTRKERKSRISRQDYVADKPPFINFASAYINPYLNLPSVVISHSRNHRSKNVKRTKRKVKHHVRSANTENIDVDENLFVKEILRNIEPIDLWPSNPNGFGMDFSRKRQIAIDNTFYREIIDSWKPLSFDNLTESIRELIDDKNIVDQVWIIFYWITQNIIYDEENIDYSFDEIIRLGKTTSDGYASLFKTLCDSLSIKCVLIRGYVKDANYKINRPEFSETNHVWNAVQLDNNHWYFTDVTWASGYMNNENQYKKYLNTFYFLTRPDYMIYNHFPEDEQWQLLSKPISNIDFYRLPNVNSYYFAYNLTLISPNFSSIINLNKDESYAEVLIQAPNDIQLNCTIKNNNYRSTCLAQYDFSRQIWQCLFAPSRIGFYTLIIYANRFSTSTVLTHVVEVGINVSSKDSIGKTPLPIVYEKFIEYKCQILSPLEGILKQGNKVLINIRIPNASHARILIDDVWLEEIQLKDHILKQQITVPTSKQITVYATFTNKKLSNVYSGLVRYIIES